MLNVQTQKLEDVNILRLEGRIVTGEIETLLKAVLSQSDATVVVLDLAQVRAIDAYGLGVLLQLRELTRSRGIQFRLTNASELVLHLLEITCLNTVFEIGSESDVLTVAEGD